jgi:2-dehydropantoate 2-reductase
MRILIVGAGAIGGYFGGRLLEAGVDVTFLVRPRRAAELALSGLIIKSPKGEAILKKPPTVRAEDLRDPYDLILLSCKAYDLDDAIVSFAPAVGPKTSILPLLNGMRHLEVLENRFERDRVLGGQCLIAVTLDEHRQIVHLNNTHELSFGERDAPSSDRVRAIAEEMASAAFDTRLSDQIVQEMWEKWVFLTALAGSTCLMRAAIGDIIQAPNGSHIVLDLLEECAAVAQANGHQPRAANMQRSRAALTATGSPLTASMLRDIERGAPVEADHIVGDLIRRGTQTDARVSDLTLLRVAYASLKAYEARENRLRAEAAKR